MAIYTISWSLCFLIYEMGVATIPRVVMRIRRVDKCTVVSTVLCDGQVLGILHSGLPLPHPGLSS
jgi:hypothetical protein